MSADPHTSDAIRLEGLVKRYPARELPALAELSLRVMAGEFLALMGPSGSGKTTLLNLIGALDSPTAGKLQVFGQDLTVLNDGELTIYRRESVGFVFQTFHLIPALTALENVMTPMVADRKRKRRPQLAKAALESVGLAGKERQLPGELSGGEQQRVAIARALIMEPRLLLADEPTGNLDVNTGEDVMELIEDLRRDRSMTVLLATHDPGVALRAERVVALRDGHQVADVYVRAEDTREAFMAKIGGSRTN